MLVVLYVMDSLRPDFLSCYGYRKETSPWIDKLANEGVLFENAFAQSTWTRPSGASLLTSAYPSVHTVLKREDVLPCNIPLLTEQLKKNGFETIALSSIGHISPDFGFGRGFDRFIQLYKEEKLVEKGRFLKANNTPTPASEDINGVLFPLLQENGKKNAFVLIWSADTHSPYFHRDKEMAKFCPPTQQMVRLKDIDRMRTEDQIGRVKALYEDMIYYNDHYLGMLIEKLKELGLFDQTFFILTGDHGEAFGEHGFFSHANVPYDELIRVPLVMKFPESKYKGKVCSIVQHIDVAPTILEYAGIAENDMWLQGQSLIPLVRDHIKISDFALAEHQLSAEVSKYTSLRSEDYKYMEIRPGRFAIRRPFSQTLSPMICWVLRKHMLFCLREDPGEKINIFKQERMVAKRLKSQVRTVLEGNEKISRAFRRMKIKQADMDTDVARQLKALGYIDD